MAHLTRLFSYFQILLIKNFQLLFLHLNARNNLSDLNNLLGKIITQSVAYQSKDSFTWCYGCSDQLMRPDLIIRMTNVSHGSRNYRSTYAEKG